MFEVCTEACACNCMPHMPKPAAHKEGVVEIDEQTDMLFLNYNFVLKNFQFCYPLYVDNRTTVIYK